jgi:hypothetical protein
MTDTAELHDFTESGQLLACTTRQDRSGHGRRLDRDRKVENEENQD